MLKNRIQESPLVGDRWLKEAQFWSDPKVGRAELLEKWEGNPWIPGAQEEPSTEDSVWDDNYLILEL